MLEKCKKYIVEYKKWVIGTVVAVSLIGAGVIGERKNLSEVRVDEIVVGYTKSTEVAQNLLEEAQSEISEASGEKIAWDVELNFERGKGKRASSEQQLKASMEQALEQLKDEQKKLAYTLKINDYKVILANTEDITKVLEEVQEQYTDSKANVELVEKKEKLVPKVNIMTKSAKNQPVVASAKDAKVSTKKATKSENSQVVKVRFAEEIEVLETYAKPENIVSVEEAVLDVTKEKEKKETYEIQAGDTISGIANGNGMTVKQFMKMNKEIKNSDKIMPGDEVVIAIPKPELSVLVQKEETYKEKYKVKPVYVENDAMYEGETNVLRKGKAGVRSVTALVSYKNGEEYKRKVAEKEVVKEAVAEKIEKGTKIRPTFIKPLDGGRFSSPFGRRWGRMHEGVDWACSVGTPIQASCAGTVTQAGWQNGYGYCVTISHGEGMSTKYAHMNRTAVSVGDHVAQGETVGYSGNTGRSTGPHLHFEIRKNGVAQNPLSYL